MTASAAADPRSDLGALGTDPVFMLIRAGAVGSARGNEVLHQMGLKTRDYSIISTASTRETTQKELADFLMLNPSQVVALVDDLEARGLVKRTTSPHDRRAKIVVPTARGEKVFVEARERLAQTHEAIFAPLTQQERDTLLHVLPLLAFPDDITL
jgi:DNA-binding MarR family transcriptional regulator